MTGTANDDVVYIREGICADVLGPVTHIGRVDIKRNYRNLLNQKLTNEIRQLRGEPWGNPELTSNCSDS